MRPIVLVVDPPDPETLSTRKLVLESAKFNVLTGDSMNEAYEILEACPVSAAIFHERALGASDPSEIITKLQKKVPDLPVIVLSPCPDGLTGTRVLSSHEPIELMRFLQTMLHVPYDPAEVMRCERRHRSET